ncbi:AgrD family cyclic lactone autoinducer peptide [Azomonas macrocytogenes]
MTAYYEITVVAEKAAATVSWIILYRPKIRILFRLNKSADIQPSSA